MMENFQLSLVKIEPVGTTQVSELQRISIETFLQAFAEENDEKYMRDYINESFSLESLNQQLRNPFSEFFFALYSGNPVGYLKINFQGGQTEDVLKESLEIERIYVLESFQGLKIGNILFEKALGEAKINNLKWIWLGVWKENYSAIKFYQKYGFEIFGEHSFFLGQDEQIDFLMKVKVD